MPRDALGVVTLPVGNPVVAGTAISADVANATVADLASMIEDSLSRSGKGGMASAMQFVKSIATTPSITFVGDTDTGINSDTGGKVDLVGNGTVALAATSAGIAIPGTLGVTGAATLASTLAVTGVITATAGMACNAQKITGVLDPTNAQDAATKAYVDTATIGSASLVWTQPTAGVNAVTTLLRTAKMANGMVVFSGKVSFTGAVGVGDVFIASGFPPWSVASGGYTSFLATAVAANSATGTISSYNLLFNVNGGHLEVSIPAAPAAFDANWTLYMDTIIYYSA
jgi:hypothetical protein